MCSCPCSCPLCVDAMCTRGPVPLAYMCSQPCESLSCLIVLLSGFCLGGYWSYWYMSPLTLNMHVSLCLGLTSSLLCVRMCGCMSRIFPVPGGRCVSLHVFHHWPGYLCQSQHGCPGCVWMWVVCKWGKGVSVCEWASWHPTMYETPLG